MATSSSTDAKVPPNRWLTSVASLPLGVSQIYFQSNVWTGLLIFLGFLVADWQMAVLVLIGTVASTVAGILVTGKTDDLQTGMQGFNGALAGAAVYTALGDQGWSYLVAVIAGAACAPVTWFVVWLFATPPLARFNLPSTTAPFCAVAGIMFVATQNIHARSAPHHIDDGTGESLLRSLLTNVSEVVLVNSVWSGALILLGLFVASWKVGLAGAMGSAIGTVCAIALGESSNTIAEGLAGYSGVLTAIALSVVFMQSTLISWLYAAIGTVVTAVVTLLMTEHYGGPHYTWPYILTTWVFLVIAVFIPALKRP